MNIKKTIKDGIMKIEDLNLNPNLLRAIKDLGYTELTPIQEKCIPEIRQGKDVVGQSSTGSGKTVAFGLPIIEKIEPSKGIQSLILTPTRELCVQVTDAINTLGEYMHVKATSIYGGVGIEPQIQSIKRADIVIGTPGRIIDHIRRRTISFDNVKILVLDEADRMFDMGFIEDVEFIISNVPKKRQTLLFSATIPNEIHRLVEKHLHSPVIIKTQIHVAKHLLKQIYYDVRQAEKFSLLVHLLKKNSDGFALVFCATRREANIVGRNLSAQGIRAMTIHGGLTQGRRMDAIEALKKRTINVLVATDVAARGLDIRNVSHVYNYDVPKTSDEYVHRIGRTARAGEEGDAITILTERDYDNFRNVLRDRTLDVIKTEKPEFEFIEFRRPQRFGNEDRYNRGSSSYNRGSRDRNRHEERGRGRRFQSRRRSRSSDRGRRR
jgi:ATP-dependent RNA helicase DeaD